MKIDKLDQHEMVYQILKHLKDKGFNDYQLGLIRFCLEDNILMNINIDGQNYQVPYRYWLDFTNAHANCCGSCNEDTLYEVERSKKAAIENGIEVTNHAWLY
jgi:hypothetical protein